MATPDPPGLERAPHGNLPRTVAILLAAGASRRMGGANKLLLPVGDEPMIRRLARTLLASRATSVTVVTGHEAERVAAALEGLSVRRVHNPHHADGQMTSVRAGCSRPRPRTATWSVPAISRPCARPRSTI